VLLATANRAEAAFPGKNGQIAFVSSRDGNEEIYVMDANGTNQTRLTTEPERDMHPMFSPDGKRVTFTSRRPGGVIDETIYVMDPKDTFPQDGNGDHHTKLTPAPSPNFMSAFSPDGKRMVFVRNEGGDTEIYVMNADGTNPVQLTDNTANDSRPVYSPDGTKIAYNRRDPNSPDLSRRRLDVYVMNADGTEQTRLTTTPEADRAADSNPSFSPDGEKIAFNSDRDGNVEIYVMDANGTEQTRLTFDPDSTDESPAFSPDGKQLAFSSDRDGNAEIWVMNAEGTGAPIRLTETDAPAQNTRPDWGPLLYDFDGFHEPVNNLPTTNVVKAGSAVPVKFGLGGDQGLDILATGYPKSQQINCDTTIPFDTIEETLTAGESGLSYDAATDHYTYTWKTKKAWGNTCRRLLVKLDDTTVHQATFEFR